MKIEKILKKLLLSFDDHSESQGSRHGAVSKNSYNPGQNIETLTNSTVKSRFGNNVSLGDIIEVTNTCDIDTLRSNQDELAAVRPTPNSYKCQKTGHLARNYRNDPCNICKKLGHHESTCWFKTKGNESAKL